MATSITIESNKKVINQEPEIDVLGNFKNQINKTIIKSTRGTNGTENAQLPVARSMRSIILTITSSIICFIVLNVVVLIAVIRHLYRRYILNHKHAILEESSFDQFHKEVEVNYTLSYYAELLGLKIQQYKVVTDDGFILEVERLYNPEVEISTINRRKPIFLLHGLLGSSGCFLSGGKKSLAYLLVSRNYDVWLGNNRGGHFPNHTKFSENDPRMWDWDVNEMVMYDIPVIINQILTINEHGGKLSVLAHSQGCAQMAMLFENKNSLQYTQKIDKCIFLAPAIYRGRLLCEKTFFIFVKNLPDFLFDIVFGIKSFIPLLMHLKIHIGGTFLFRRVAPAVTSYIFDCSDCLWEKEIRKIHLAFVPVFVSVKLIKWWTRSDNTGAVTLNKSVIGNRNAWFGNETPQLLLFSGGVDAMVDVDMFEERLKTIEHSMVGKWKHHKINEYAHLDFLWAHDLKEKIGQDILEFLS